MLLQSVQAASPPQYTELKQQNDTLRPMQRVKQSILESLWKILRWYYITMLQFEPKHSTQRSSTKTARFDRCSNSNGIYLTRYGELQDRILDASVCHNQISNTRQWEEAQAHRTGLKQQNRPPPTDAATQTVYKALNYSNFRNFCDGSVSPYAVTKRSSSSQTTHRPIKPMHLLYS